MMAPLWSNPDLPALLAADIAERPADPRWRRKLAPSITYGRHAGPVRPDARLAAVAIVLCWEDAEWVLPLTLRGAGLSRHGGQVSLPGGLVDGDETTRDAAQRELGEELGVSPQLSWLGELAPLFVYASNALVTPCVAAVNHLPNWSAQPPEVDRVLQLSVGDLVCQELAEPMPIRRGPLEFSAPRLVIEGESTWGATAVLLSELRGRLRRVAEQK